ncbi:MAG: transporter substrate-binding domain-containing protein, partial [Anaerotignaceae bacterium]
MTKKISLYFSTILLILFSILSYTNVSFASQEKTVRVGYFINEGFQNAAENGTYSGYGYEYLQNLAEYTNWNYEYVEASWRECFTLLENGEIDIMGFVHKTPTREEKYSFPNFNSGFNETKLLTSQYNTTLAPNAYEDYNGINIGVLSNSLTLNQLRDFANSNSFTYTETTYSSTERMYTGLKMGEVDAICTNLAVAPEHTRILSFFELQPFYYIVNKNNTELLNELNNAIYQLKTESPYLEDDLKKKYFTSATDTSVIFSSSERAFIENHEPLLVLVDPDFMPIEGFDKNSNIATGFSVSLLDKISQMSGLKFEYTYADAYADAEEMIMNYEIDILSSVNPKYVELEENLMSDSYLNSSVVLIGKQNFNLDNKGVIVAMTKKSAAMEKSIAKIYPDCLFIYYNSGHEAYDAVLKGSADLIARNLYSAQAELFTDYKDLKIIYDLGDYANFRFAFSQEMPDVLASIFNKCLKSISEADKNGMMV